MSEQNRSKCVSWTVANPKLAGQKAWCKLICEQGHEKPRRKYSDGDGTMEQRHNGLAIDSIEAKQDTIQRCAISPTSCSSRDLYIANSISIICPC